MDQGAHDNRPEELLADIVWVRRLAGALTKDVHAADDLAQNVWVAALRHSGGSSARSWMVAVARKLSRRELRSDRHRKDREERLAPPEGLEPTADLCARAALHRELVDRVMALNEPFRTVVLMRYLDDLPPREIARRLDVPVRTVGSRLRRGLEALRADLDLRSGGRERWLHAAVALAGTDSTHGTGIVGGIIMGTKAKVAGIVVAVTVCTLGVRELAQRGDEALLSAGAPSRAAEGEIGGTAAALAAAPSPDSRAPVDGAGAAASELPATLLVRGRVMDGCLPELGIDPSPTPEARVSVWLSREEIQSPAFRTVDAEAAVRAGVFEAALEDPGYRPVHLYLQVPGEGVHRWASARAAIAVGDHAASVEILRPHEGLLCGTVRDESEVAIEGALVTGFPQQVGQAEVQAITDAEGRFELAAVGPISRLGARASGYTVIRAPTPRRREGGGYQDAAILVARAGQMVVRVRDATGAPIAGATLRVRLAQEELAPAPFSEGVEVRSADTDENGLAHVTGVWIGRKVQVGFRSGRTPTTRSANAITVLSEPEKVYDKVHAAVLRRAEEEEGAPLVLPSHGVLEVELRAPSELVVRGHVTLPDGSPVPDPAFEIFDEGRASWDDARLLSSGTGDAQGAFEVRLLRERVHGHLGVLAVDGTLASGFVAKWPIGYGARLVLDPEDAVADGEGHGVLSAEIQLAPTHAISGRLVDEGGEPLGESYGNRVYAVPAGAPHPYEPTALGRVASAKVEQDGFRIEALPEGVYDMYATRRHETELADVRYLPTGLVRVPNVPAGTAGLDIVVPRQGGVHVRLHLDDEGPVDFLGVLVGSFHPTDGRTPTAEPPVIRAGELGSWPARSNWDANGPVSEDGPNGHGRYVVFTVEDTEIYDLPELGEGWYRFGVRTKRREEGMGSGLAHYPIATDPVYLRPGDYEVRFGLTAVVPFEGRLVSEEPIAHLAVQLLDPRGRPLSQKIAGGMFGRMVTQFRVAANGTFGLPSAPVGKRTLRVGTPAQLERGDFLREIEVEVPPPGVANWPPTEIRL